MTRAFSEPAINMKHDTIHRFVGEFEFLSNFYPCELMLDGEVYRSVEHAYQASKTADPASRKLVQSARTPLKAKRLGRRVPLRPGWNRVKVSVMRSLLEAKFKDPVLRNRLIATGLVELVEGNHWHDTFWGCCFCGRCGGGRNWLGKLLMETRAHLAEV